MYPVLILAARKMRQGHFLNWVNWRKERVFGHNLCYMPYCCSYIYFLLLLHFYIPWPRWKTSWGQGQEFHDNCTHPSEQLSVKPCMFLCPSYVPLLSLNVFRRWAEWSLESHTRMAKRAGRPGSTRGRQKLLANTTRSCMKKKKHAQVGDLHFFTVCFLDASLTNELKFVQT